MASSGMVPRSRAKSAAGLLPEVRRAWMAEHALPPHVRYYSIAGFTSRKFLSRGLVFSWEKLVAADLRDFEAALEVVVRAIGTPRDPMTSSRDLMERTAE
jgi:hypothetical protein